MSRPLQVRQSLVSAMITNCALQVYLAYIELAYQRPSIALFIGTMFHSTYEFYFKQKLLGTELSLNDLVDHYSDLWTKSFKSDTNMYGLSVNQARMIGFSLVTTYWPVAREYNIASSEETGYIQLGDDRIITHTDIRLTSGKIVEMKSARTFHGRNGEYFPDYSDKSVLYKPQPMIHMLAYSGVTGYSYDVIGKGDNELYESFPVKHSQQRLNSFKLNTLIPVMAQIKSGDFPAKPSALCGSCEWFKSSKCGVGL